MIFLCQKFTPVSDNFIQVLNISSKHWTLVFWRKFAQISICDSTVTNEKYPKTLLKVYIASQNFHGSVLLLRILPIQQQKILLIVEYLLLLMQLKFYMMKWWRFFIRY